MTTQSVRKQAQVYADMAVGSDEGLPLLSEWLVLLRSPPPLSDSPALEALIAEIQQAQARMQPLLDRQQTLQSLAGPPRLENAADCQALLGKLLKAHCEQTRQTQAHEALRALVEPPQQDIAALASAVEDLANEPGASNGRQLDVRRQEALAALSAPPEFQDPAALEGLAEDLHAEQLERECQSEASRALKKLEPPSEPGDLTRLRGVIDALHSAKEELTERARQRDQRKALKRLMPPPPCQDPAPCEALIADFNEAQKACERTTKVSQVLADLPSPPELSDIKPAAMAIEQFARVKEDLARYQRDLDSDQTLTSLVAPPQVEEASALAALVANLEQSTRVQAHYEELKRALEALTVPPERLESGHLEEVLQALTEARPAFLEYDFLRQKRHALEHLNGLPAVEDVPEHQTFFARFHRAQRQQEHQTEVRSALQGLADPSELSDPTPLAGTVGLLAEAEQSLACWEERLTAASALLSPPVPKRTEELDALCDNLTKTQRWVSTGRQEVACLAETQKPPVVARTAPHESFFGELKTARRDYERELDRRDVLETLKGPPPLADLTLLMNLTSGLRRAQDELKKIGFRRTVRKALVAAALGVTVGVTAALAYSTFNKFLVPLYDQIMAPAPEEQESGIRSQESGVSTQVGLTPDS